jgi:hypothetical protein
MTIGSTSPKTPSQQPPSPQSPQSKSPQSKSPQSKSPRELDDFLALFPHRQDWISSPLQGFGKPQWRTESRFPLSDRRILKGKDFYGVRFSPNTTRYALLDIDSGSPYHPKQDPLAIDRILNYLEEIGIVNHIRIQSSYSGGIHLYLPFPHAIRTWKVALALTTLLETKGFIIQNGVLEAFPNRRTSPTQLYQAHRLPLQQGSYLLDLDFQPIGGEQFSFVHQWRYCQSRSDTTEEMIDRSIARYHRRTYHLSKKATQFLQDLDTDIDCGWTGSGQTNNLLGRIALRGYCFGHFLEDNDRVLEGDRLVQYIVRTARSLPGFEEFCNHKHDLIKRAEAWTRSVQKSKYFHCGVKRSKDPEKLENTWNEFQKDLAQLRITIAVEEIRGRETLKAGIRDRLLQISKETGISAATLYKYKELWYPGIYQSPEETLAAEENPLSLLKHLGWIIKLEKNFRRLNWKKLYQTGCNMALAAGFRRCPPIATWTSDRFSPIE